MKYVRRFIFLDIYMDVFGKALQDFHQFGRADKLWLHNNYGEPEDMPVDVFFRSEDDLSVLEEYALDLCEGKILDIGAGVGAHSLLLQSQGFDVTALEMSAAACEIMKSRGVKKVINGNIFFRQKVYDTLLLMMNGIGLCGDVDGLRILLSHLKQFLNTDGQIILDSSDISYLYNAGNFPTENYYGEISYQYEYQLIKGDWFNWLYVDPDSLGRIARQNGFLCEILFEDELDQYLARLTHFR